MKRPEIPLQSSIPVLQAQKRRRRRRECVQCHGKIYLETAPVCPNPPEGKRGSLCHPAPPTRKRTCMHCGQMFLPVLDTAPYCEARQDDLKCEAKPWGFAAMDPERRREAAVKGVKLLRELGVNHTFTKEEAVVAGRKGGRAPHRIPPGRKPRSSSTLP